MERFGRMVSVADSGCWLWTGGEVGGGYGSFFDGKRLVAAHRYFYEAIFGPVPREMDIDHLCRVRLCVSPFHLEAVTRQENLLRARRLITKCPNGHPYDTTVLSRSIPVRRCRTCARAAVRRNVAKRRQTRAEARTLLSAAQKG